MAAQPELPKPAEIADRILSAYQATSPRKKAKSLLLPKAQFNALAGRSKIDGDAIFTPTAAALKRKTKHTLMLVRVGGDFAVLDRATIDGFDVATKAVIAASKKAPSPAAAWPFSTGGLP